MVTATRQDLLSITEGAKNKIIERLVTRYDVQAACDSARDRIIGVLNEFHQENVLLMRQSNSQRDQMWRKTLALEAQVASLRQEIRNMHQLMYRMSETLVR